MSFASEHGPKALSSASLLTWTQGSASLWRTTGPEVWCARQGLRRAGSCALEGYGRKPTFAGFGSLATHQAGMQRSSRSCHIFVGYHLGQMGIGYDAAKSGPSTCAATTATSTKRPSSSRALLQCRCLVVCLQCAHCLSSPRSRYVADPLNAFTS